MIDDKRDKKKTETFESIRRSTTFRGFHLDLSGCINIEYIVSYKSTINGVTSKKVDKTNSASSSKRLI